MKNAGESPCIHIPASICLDAPEKYDSQMAWVTPHNTREIINIAGRDLNALERHDPKRDEALDIINNWRSCHSYPLHIVTKTLFGRARRKVNTNALVARRIKRLSSISLKLQHNPSMRLSQMQDIGGCRAVLNSVVEVEKLVKVYEDAARKNPHAPDRPLLVKKDDYIEEPKEDGYRSVHLIMKYHSTAKPQYNGQKIEIQIRSKLQHAWATAVETCQTFTGQALKSKIKSASNDWLNFFALMSSAFAAREKRPNVPGTPTDKKERKRLIKEIVEKENIITLLQGWSAAIQREEHIVSKGSVAYLLELNTSQKYMRLIPFREDEMNVAHSTYLAREKATEKSPEVQVVLVSADSVANLRRAYPNYYVDTTVFIQAINQELAG